MEGTCRGFGNNVRWLASLVCMCCMYVFACSCVTQKLYHLSKQSHGQPHDSGLSQQSKVRKRTSFIVQSSYMRLLAMDRRSHAEPVARYYICTKAAFNETEGAKQSQHLSIHQNSTKRLHLEISVINCVVGSVARGAHLQPNAAYLERFQMHADMRMRA